MTELTVELIVCGAIVAVVLLSLAVGALTRIADTLERWRKDDHSV